ncbi:MAG: NAD(P)/FAD-dependent oxidoreductase [Phaeodactylibacter sp.]|nr:NAD(P)/FAD-dependent oxidoreductase [Phaeodactylibacter sp.]MCB9273231.1 NAD(P)/FAD-dependent oxidoreductase [Lewinellaceae bacterium]
MSDNTVLIIGAGPAGLAMGGRLRQLGIPFDIIEKSAHVGNAWREHYDRLRLHTVKEHSYLPGLPFPDEYPLYVTRQLMADYYEAYAKAFGLRPHFGEEALGISPVEGGWAVRATSGKAYTARHVVFATGVNRVPYRPSFAGENSFTGQVLHSRSYKNHKAFVRQRVLVAGMGNTGAEIALDLSENGIITYLSVRGPVNIVPRDFMGRPTQKTALLLARLPNWLGDWIGAQVQSIAFGDLRPYGLEKPVLPPARQLRETGKTPVIDLGTVSQIKAGRIKVVPEIDMFTERGVRLADGQEVEVDSVILATGYRAELESFMPFTDGLFNTDGLPGQCIGQGKYEGLYFLGFDNYKPGGILGIIRQESEMIAEKIAKAG